MKIPLTRASDELRREMAEWFGKDLSDAEPPIEDIRKWVKKADAILGADIRLHPLEREWLIGVVDEGPKAIERLENR